MLSSFQHPRSSIFLSLEQVTLSSPCVRTPAPPPHPQPPTPPPTAQPRTSMACSLDGPPWNKNTCRLSKASFICSKQKEGFTSALFPPLGLGLGPFSPLVSSSLPPAHTPTGAFQRGAVGVRGTPFMFTCVHVRSLCRTCPLHNRRANRLTSSF